MTYCVSTAHLYGGAYPFPDNPVPYWFAPESDDESALENRSDPAGGPCPGPILASDTFEVDEEGWAITSGTGSPSAARDTAQAHTAAAALKITNGISAATALSSAVPVTAGKCYRFDFYCLTEVDTSVQVEVVCYDLGAAEVAAQGTGSRDLPAAPGWHHVVVWALAVPDAATMRGRVTVEAPSFSSVWVDDVTWRQDNYPPIGSYQVNGASPDGRYLYAPDVIDEVAYVTRIDTTDWTIEAPWAAGPDMTGSTLDNFWRLNVDTDGRLLWGMLSSGTGFPATGYVYRTDADGATTDLLAEITWPTPDAPGDDQWLFEVLVVNQGADGAYYAMVRRSSDTDGAPYARLSSTVYRAIEGDTPTEVTALTIDDGDERIAWYDMVAVTDDGGDTVLMLSANDLSASWRASSDKDGMFHYRVGDGTYSILPTHADAVEGFSQTGDMAVLPTGDVIYSMYGVDIWWETIVQEGPAGVLAFGVVNTEGADNPLAQINGCGSTARVERFVYPFSWGDITGIAQTPQVDIAGTATRLISSFAPASVPAPDPPPPPPAQAEPDDEEGESYVIDDSSHDCYRYDDFEVSGELTDLHERPRWRWRCVVCDREYGKGPPPKSSVLPQTDGVP